jgi:hypothetical protein
MTFGGENEVMIVKQLKFWIGWENVLYSGK